MPWPPEDRPIKGEWIVNLLAVLLIVLLLLALLGGASPYGIRGGRPYYGVGYGWGGGGLGLILVVVLILVLLGRL